MNNTNENNILSNYKFQKLTPKSDMDLGIFERAIDHAFADPDIRNVAISGSYGAGKSSVIETYKEKQQNAPKKKFLHISLAHFEKVSEDEMSTMDHWDNARKMEARIEGKIINQLIHQLEPEKIPLTNFKVKREVDEGKIKLYTTWCVCTVILLLFVLFHSKWKGLIGATVGDNQAGDLLRNEWGVLLAGILLLGLSIIGIYTLVGLQLRKKFLKKVKIQDNEIEIMEDCEDSYFDRYLNEVLYLFENADVDAIVFEDIDRFGGNGIFVKIREINTLLKNRGKNIVFFYLLKDDLFETTDRTKFFDFIIPVMPVVDGSNAYEKFVKHFRDAGILDLFTNEFLKGIALFVDDMRILKNIQNEFVIYHERLPVEEIGLEGDKLLAMITYKNLFPKDFSDLQLKRGYVYTLFANKDALREQELIRLSEEIKGMREKLQGAEKEVCQSVEELEGIYFWCGKTLRVNNKEEAAFANRTAFVKAIKENPNQVEYRYGSSFYDWRDFDAKPIFDEIHSSDEYKKRKEFIELKAEQEKRKVRTKIAIIEGEKQTLQQKPLRLLINRDNKNKVFNVIYKNALNEEEKFEAIKRSPYFDLIQYLIRRGYIDESYPDYMTYFYENSISANDKKFLRGVLGEKAEAYDYALVNPHRVIEELELRHFAQEETLNFELLDCMLENSAEYREQLNKFLYRIYTEEPADFVAQYLQRKLNVREFVREMNAGWNDTCDWILTEEDLETVRAEYIIATLCVSSDETIIAGNQKGLIKEYVETNIAAVEVLDEEVEKISNGIMLLGAKIRRVNFEKMNMNLLAKIYQNHAYELNAPMVEVMLECFYRLAPDDGWESNLTQIFAESEAPLCQYVKENIAEYIKVVLGQTVTIFDEEPVILYVLNHELIDDSDKRQYIEQLMSTISSLEEVKDIELWSLIMKEELVAENEKNMCDYYFKSGNGLDEHLIHYINESENILTVEKMELDKAYSEGSRNNMYQAVLRCDELNDERYEKLILSFRYHYTKFSVEGLALNKLLILVKVHMIWMTESNLKFLRTEYPDALKAFIQKNIEDYIKLVQEKGIFEKDELVYLLMEYPTGISFVDEGITQLAAEHTEYIMEEALPIDLGLMKSLLSGDMIEKDQKKELLALLLPEMKKTDVVECLKLAGLDKFHSIFLGKHPSFEMTEVNEKLLSALENNHLISSFSKDKQNEGYYKAYGKRK